MRASAAGPARTDATPPEPQNRYKSMERLATPLLGLLPVAMFCRLEDFASEGRRERPAQLEVGLMREPDHRAPFHADKHGRPRKSKAAGCALYTGSTLAVNSVLLPSDFRYRCVHSNEIA